MKSRRKTKRRVTGCGFSRSLAVALAAGQVTDGGARSGFAMSFA